jgi:type VI secretion system protein ImpF
MFRDQMKINQNRQNIQVSILDRLVDQDPGVSRESLQYRLTDFGRVKALVIRDLENLLNTKSIVTPPARAYKELNKSLYVYGLKDFTAQNPKSPSVRQQLREELRSKISQFEPRLKNVTVGIDAPTEGDMTVRFKITGLLVLDPIAEPIAFDTLLDITRSEYTIPK